jgi:hypothetical protein
MEKKSRQDEIDLLDLLLKGINVIRANLGLLVFLTLLGAAVGLLKYYTARKVFENKMVISSGILTRSYGKVLFDKLNRRMGESDTEAVARDLKISKETLRSIKKIQIEDLAEEDVAKESDRFIVTVETYNQNSLPEIQKGLVYYLENNEFVKIRVEQNKNSLRQTLAKLDQEIAVLEEFKNRLFKGDFFQSNRGNVMFDPTVVNSKILELTKEKINLQNALELANSVQVIEGFTPFEKPAKPRLLYSLIIGTFTGFFLAGLVIVFKSVRKLVKMADEAALT